MASAASRTSGVAPLYVFFEADLVASTAEAQPFLDREYIWSFGDTGAGTWGTTGLSKNAAKGPTTAHVFETAGTYTVTLTVKEAGSTIDTDTFEITVTDPDTVYAGENTICVSDVAHDDFTGAPSGCVELTTDDLSDIEGYIAAGRRILFQRGSSWTHGAITMDGNAGPVTFGAYGTGTSPDALGIYTNAPVITQTGGFWSVPGSGSAAKVDWRIMDISFVGTDGIEQLPSAVDMRHYLMFRCKSAGFRLIGWGHYKYDSADLNDVMAVVGCDIDGGHYGIYVGSERLAVLGNLVHDIEASHALRVVQAYKCVIGHNDLSEANLANESIGTHAMKLHGPSQTEIDPEGIQGALNHGSQFITISDNVFGSSGPWPVAIGPQNGEVDERLTDIVFERNRCHADHGTANDYLVRMPIHVWARYVVLRNNVIGDCGGVDTGFAYTGITIERRGVEPTPLAIDVYNNTIYCDVVNLTEGGGTRTGIRLTSDCDGIVVKNNLVCFPGGEDVKTLLVDGAPDTDDSNNLLVADPDFADPDNANPLLRDYSIADDSEAVDTGTAVPVYEDFDGATRTGTYDVGAYEYHDASTYSVVYDGNGPTSGSVPTDGTDYSETDPVTVLGNTGALKRTYYAFKCWNTQADGGGTDYYPGATLSMPGENLTLYAIWVTAYVVM